MDETVKRALLRSGIVGAALAGSLIMVPALAQTLTDPTQPPPEARLAVSGEAAAAPVRTGPQLQSVLLGSGGRRVAVIDGQTVRTGESVNGATLVQVEKDRVVLQHGRVKQVLRLYPDAGAAAKAAAHSR